MVVGIHAGDRMRDYGVAGNPDYLGRGDKADLYAAFITDELYPYVKKKAGVRKFASVVMAGCSLGGLSAFDIAWNHADLIDKVGVFSGSFWWRDLDAQSPVYNDSTDRIMLSVTRSSVKKPHLQYWFYAGGKEEESDRDKDGIIDVEDDTQDLISIIESKNVCPPDDIEYNEDPEGKHDYPYWSKQLPFFLTWAFGK
jgi:enterochelin esterase-like enzyme